MFDITSIIALIMIATGIVLIVGAVKILKNHDDDDDDDNV